MRKRRGSAALVMFVFAGMLLVLAPSAAWAVPSLRHQKCLTRANAYAADEHPGLTPAQEQEHIDWLYAQCAENDAAEAIAEEQGALAPALFPNLEHDRHAHPLHCMSLTDGRFGMHTNDDAPNPPDDPNGPGGAAAVNVPGEFMYAYIDGEARFLVRYVVWTVDDRAGNPVTPVRIMQQPQYMGTPQTPVAQLDFTTAYEPVSVWVEFPDTMNTARNVSGVLPGRAFNVRTWMESKCHDKRAEVVMPQMLIDHVKALGWLDSQASPQQARALRFVSDGDPSQASSWSIVELPVDVANGQVHTKNGYRWFYDSAVTYDSTDNLGPVVTAAHSPGAVFSGPDVTLSGSATDNVAVDAVSITVRDSSGDYLKPDGSFAPGTSQLPASLDHAGSAATGWAITVTLPPGVYDLEVTAVDTSSNATTLSDADFSVDPSGPDGEDPTIDMDHEIDTVFAGPDVTITGWAADNQGVTAVEVQIKDRVTKEWLQPDGSFGSKIRLPVTIDQPGATFTTWSIAVSLQPAGYNIEAFAYDAAGNEGQNPTWKKFDVVDGGGGGGGGGGTDTGDPTIAVDYAANAQFPGPDVTLTGVADDDTGVVTVEVKIKDRDTGLWLQANGTWGSAAVWHEAAVIGSGPSVTWSIDFTLPNGRYNPVARAHDAVGNRGTQTDFRPIRVT